MLTPENVRKAFHLLTELETVNHEIRPVKTFTIQLRE